MERLDIQFGDEAFDKAVHGAGTSECGDLAIASKDKCMVGGNPGVVVHFTAGIPYGLEPVSMIGPYDKMPQGGRTFKVQAVTSVKLFLMAAAALCGKYPDIAKEMGIHVVGPRPNTHSTSNN
jgi:hypothetical protein